MATGPMGMTRAKSTAAIGSAGRRAPIRLALALALPAAALLAAPAAAGADGISLRPSGALVVEGIAADGALSESRRDASGPGGRLGFLSAGEWHHATSLRSESGKPGGERGVILETDDPAGRRIVVTIEPREGGVDSLEAEVRGEGPPVESVGIGFAATDTERMLGFGERSNRVDQRGRVVENYVGEGPYQPSEYAAIANTVPPWGFRERRDASYFPMPWLLSTRGYGVLSENLETSRFRLGTEAGDEWSFEADTARLELSFFRGPKPKDALRRLTAEIGRQPRPAAPWLFGPWVQTGHQNTAPDELENLATLRDADAPYSAVETHMRYMPCGSDIGEEASERERAADLHATGAAALTYTREAICASYEAPYARAIQDGAFFEKPDGTPYTFTAFVGSGVTQVGMFDFSDPAAAPIYRSILDRAYRAGYDGWMEDYGEYTPPDAIAASGTTGKTMHNRYPVLYHREGMRYAESKSRPVIRFSRSGFTGAARHSQIVWGGDPTTGWDFDGLRSAARQALSIGLSGVSLWASDIGGFFTLSGQRLDPELLARWLQFGAFSGVMRTKAEGIGAPASARPQVWEEPTLPIYRRYAKLRTQLFPYLKAADRAYARSGMPIMRHLALAYPHDPHASSRDAEYLFGPDLLVAPIFEPDARERSVYLPRGEWVELWDAVRYREGGDGGFRIAAAAKPIEGARKIGADAPLEEIPVFAKTGTLLPLLPADVETLADYGAGSHVGLEDRRNRLHLLAFPRGKSSARFNGGGRLRSRELRRGWRLRVDSERRLRVDLEASMATLENPFRPGSVEVDGRRVERGSWSYDREAEVLRVEARLGGGSGGSVLRAYP